MEKIPTYDYFKDYLKPGVSVLDYGCSHGNLLRFDTHRVIDHKAYVGVDVDCFAIEKAKFDFPDATFLDSDRKNVVYNPHGFSVFPDLKNRKFDRILAYSVFSHADVGDIKETIAWMLRHLNGGGQLIVSVCDNNDPVGVDWFRQRRIQDYGFCEEILTDQTHVYLVDNRAQVTPPTSICRHFVSFFNIEWLLQQLSAFKVVAGTPPAGLWFQIPLIVTK
jgi:SAM-dependent methyltransferase